MTDNHDDTEKVTETPSKFASLTSGLLARKGDAVPAAAAFTAEAIAQHIPARRLAQEAKRHVGAFSALQHEMRPLKTAMQAQQLAEYSGASEVDYGSSDLDVEDSNPVPNSVDQNAQEEAVTDLEEGTTTPIDFDQIVTEALADVEDRKANMGLRAMKERLLKGARPGDLGSVLEEEIPSGKGASEPCAVKKYSSEMQRQKQAQNYEPVSGLGLDPRKFIRLQIAAMKLNMMPQDIMSAALDTYLDQLDQEVFSECNCLKKGLL